MATPSLLIAIPIVGAITSLLAGRMSPRAGRVASLVVACLGTVAAAVLLAQVSSSGVPVSIDVPWIPSFGSSFHLEADSLSASLALLAAALLPVAVLLAWDDVESNQPSFHAWLHAAVAGVQIVFLSRDAFLFYFGYELMLIPMFLIIGKWGDEDKELAALKFLLFTFAGSIFLLSSLLYLHFSHLQLTGVRTFSIVELAKTAGRLSAGEQWWVYLGFVLGFAVKIPLFPLNTWQPDTYRQCPTSGLIILAGVMSKTGLYGLIRLAGPLAPMGAIAWGPPLILLALISVFYGAFCAFAQRDAKALIAYSSLSHLGFATIGYLTSMSIGDGGYRGAVIQMVAHGFSTAGLFAAVGFIQKHAKTRELESYGGLWKHAPVLGGFFLFFSLASLGLPGTANFVGEIYVISHSFLQNPALGALMALSVMFAAAYSLKLFLVTMHGPESGRLKPLPDLGYQNVVVMGGLAAIVVILGFRPAIVLPPTKAPAAKVQSVASQVTPVKTSSPKDVRP